LGDLQAIRGTRHARVNSQSRKALTVRRAARIRQRLACVSQFLSGETGRRAAFGPVTSRECSLRRAQNPTVPFARPRQVRWTSWTTSSGRLPVMARRSHPRSRHPSSDPHVCLACAERLSRTGPAFHGPDEVDLERWLVVGRRSVPAIASRLRQSVWRVTPCSGDDEREGRRAGVGFRISPMRGELRVGEGGQCCRG